MSLLTIQDSTLTSIADAIRSKTGGVETYTPADMVAAIEGISGGGSEKPFYNWDGLSFDSLHTYQYYGRGGNYLTLPAGITDFRQIIAVFGKLGSLYIPLRSTSVKCDYCFCWGNPQAPTPGVSYMPRNYANTYLYYNPDNNNFYLSDTVPSSNKITRHYLGISSQGLYAGYKDTTSYSSSTTMPWTNNRFFYVIYGKREDGNYEIL